MLTRNDLDKATLSSLNKHYLEVRKYSKYNAFLAGFVLGYNSGWGANAERILKEVKEFKV